MNGYVEPTPRLALRYRVARREQLPGAQGDPGHRRCLSRYPTSSAPDCSRKRFHKYRHEARCRWAPQVAAIQTGSRPDGWRRASAQRPRTEDAQSGFARPTSASNRPALAVRPCSRNCGCDPGRVRVQQPFCASNARFGQGEDTLRASAVLTRSSTPKPI